MDEQHIFNFRTDISKVNIPLQLNNPFGTYIPKIAKIATKEFQEFIISDAPKWSDDLRIKKGKMFGVLVVQKIDMSYSYLGAISGKHPEGLKCNKFVPSIFDDSAGDYFINKGMLGLSELSDQIRNCNELSEVNFLKNKRRQKSIALQERLFENYNMLNLSGEKKNLLEIFDRYSSGRPPSAAGECAAPKLLQYALRFGLRPISLAEFWWGREIRNKEKKHNLFYPACKSRCRPILEYMLDDTTLFDRRNEFRNSIANEIRY